MTCSFHTAAESEFEAAVEFYDECEEGLGDEFEPRRSSHAGAGRGEAREMAHFVVWSRRAIDDVDAISLAAWLSASHVEKCAEEVATDTLRSR